MATLEVTCVTHDGPDTDRCIDGIGGSNTIQPYFFHDRLTAVWNIENGVHTYYTSVGGNVAVVRVRTSILGNKYLTTDPDGYEWNKLSKLKSCAVAA